MTKLETLLHEADAVAAKPNQIRTEIDALESELAKLNDIADPSERELARISAVSVLLTKHRKTLAALNPAADSFAVLNSPKGAAALSELLKATRDGLRDLEKDRMASAQKIFSGLAKGDPASINAEAFYSAADSAAELWTDVTNARTAISTVEGLAPAVATARLGGSWDFKTLLEMLRPAAVLVRVL